MELKNIDWNFPALNMITGAKLHLDKLIDS